VLRKLRLSDRAILRVRVWSSRRVVQFHGYNIAHRSCSTSHHTRFAPPLPWEIGSSASIHVSSPDLMTRSGDL
jgi:hypothetical protein